MMRVTGAGRRCLGDGAGVVLRVVGWISTLMTVSLSQSVGALRSSVVANAFAHPGQMAGIPVPGEVVRRARAGRALHAS